MKTLAYVLFALGLVVTLFGCSTTKEDRPASVVELPSTYTQRVEPIIIPVRNYEINFERTVQLYDEVNNNSVDSAIQQINQLAAKSSAPIFLLLASPGGSVFDGERLVSAMESSPAPVNTVCVSLCASMAAVIHQYGAERLAFDRAVLMFHDASGSVEGKVMGMHQMLSLIMNKLERTNRYIAKKSNMTYDQFMDLQKYDAWIESAEATRVHLNDKLIRYQLAPQTVAPSVKEVLDRYHHNLTLKEFNN